MAKTKRRWGDWELRTSNPTRLVCRPYGNTSSYPIALFHCNTLHGREFWLRQISEKPWGDVEGLRQAFEELVNEGTLAK